MCLVLRPNADGSWSTCFELEGLRVKLEVPPVSGQPLTRREALEAMQEKLASGFEALTRGRAKIVFFDEQVCGETIHKARMEDIGPDSEEPVPPDSE